MLLTRAKAIHLAAARLQHPRFRCHRTNGTFAFIAWRARVYAHRINIRDEDRSVAAIIASEGCVLAKPAGESPRPARWDFDNLRGQITAMGPLVVKRLIGFERASPRSGSEYTARSQCPFAAAKNTKRSAAVRNQNYSNGAALRFRSHMSAIFQREVGSSLAICILTLRQAQG